MLSRKCTLTETIMDAASGKQFVAPKVTKPVIEVAKSTGNPAAMHKEYAKKIKIVRRQLAEVSAMLRKHEAEQQTAKDWGFVGDLDSVTVQLKEVIGALKTAEFEVE